MKSIKLSSYRACVRGFLTMCLVTGSAACIAECNFPHQSGPRYIGNLTCRLTSNLAHMKVELGENVQQPACIGELRDSAQAAIAKTKACLKKEKNSEGLRALGEFWVIWSDTINALNDPEKREIVEAMFDASLNKLKVYEVIM